MPEIEPIVDEDGEVNLGRGATLWHTHFGALDRARGRPQPANGAVFRASELNGGAPTVLLEYDAEDLAEEWEDRLFESPLHAEDVLGEDDVEDGTDG